MESKHIGDGTDGLTDMVIWILVRIILALAGGMAVAAAVTGYVGILRGKSALAGAKDIDEFITWHWGDLDQATAVLRTRAQLLSVALVAGLAVLSFGVFGRRFETETLFLSCVALFVIAIWWWLEREFAWPGFFIPREARGTRGLFQARREARRRSRLGEENENLDNR